MKFLQGIYGIDLLSLILLLVASLFNLSRYTSLIGFALVIISLLRIFQEIFLKDVLKIIH